MQTKSDLISHVLAHTGFTKAQADKAVDTVLDGIGKLTENGDKLVLRGFGTFAMAHRKESKGRNPRTGEPMTIPASSRITFKQSRIKKG